MEKGFKEFLENIPDEVAKPLEREKSADETLDKSDLLINELGILKLKMGNESKETQIRMLPQIEELIADLQGVQRRNDEVYDKEGVRIALTKLINERDRIEKMIS